MKPLAAAALAVVLLVRATVTAQQTALTDAQIKSAAIEVLSLSNCWSSSQG
jgi:hypothetical protein